uniref:Uncharacterized protein n=1 Tax=viral metagenome TaxID=1070528 RepID=A0A6C0I267_9ZZZZ
MRHCILYTYIKYIFNLIIYVLLVYILFNLIIYVLLVQHNE